MIWLIKNNATFKWIAKLFDHLLIIVYVSILSFLNKKKAKHQLLLTSEMWYQMKSNKVLDWQAHKSNQVMWRCYMRKVYAFFFSQYIDTFCSSFKITLCFCLSWHVWDYDYAATSCNISGDIVCGRSDCSDWNSRMKLPPVAASSVTTIPLQIHKHCLSHLLTTCKHADILIVVSMTKYLRLFKD